MDPSTVKLTTLQKIKPLLLAINKEIPWQMVLLTSTGLIIGFFTSGALHIGMVDPAWWDFLLRRIIIGGIFSAIGFLISTVTFFFLSDKVFPLVGKIRANYNEEALKVKKEILDNVIDDEILKK